MSDCILVMLGLFEIAGFMVTSDRSASPSGITRYRVVARDDYGDLQIVLAATEIEALTELARTLGLSSR